MKQSKRKNDTFRKISSEVSKITGSSKSFITASCIILTWAATGPLFGFSNTWQLVINTFTTITTFLMVFLIQNTQNRDTKAVHLKLDELVRAVKGARLSLLESEDLSDEELDELRAEYQALKAKYEKSLEKRRKKN